METATKTMIELPALKRGRAIITLGFKISSDIENWGARAIDVYKEAPTLAQLRYADSSSTQIRENIRSHRYTGEFTADFVDYDAHKPGKSPLPKGFLYVKLFQRPESVKEENGVWRAEGNWRGMVVPPAGWQAPEGKLLYNTETGFPMRTVESREEAVKMLSKIMPKEQAEKEVSYFWRWEENHKRLSPVSRNCGWAAEDGPWPVDASWYGPLNSNPRVGFRAVRDLTKTMYVIDERTYNKVLEELETVKSGNLRVKDLAQGADRILNSNSTLSSDGGCQ